jgi:hypothetical protein
MALSLASILKARLLCRLLEAPVQGWRWSLILAGAAATAVGAFVTLLPRELEWIEIFFGAPAILITFGLVVWYRGFTAEDRTLFKMGKGEKATLPPDELGVL